jgi:uncharacterized protein (TIRG00374 family)
VSRRGSRRRKTTASDDASPTSPADVRNEKPLLWKTVVKRGAVVAVSGLAIYLVLPSITEVLASWPRLSTLDPAWFAAAVAFQVAHFTCTFALQRLALRTKGWFAVVTAGLAGNAITAIVPAGDVAGAAVQFRMLAISGIDTDVAVGGLTAFSLLGIGGLLALPLFSLPAIIFGAPVSKGLVHTAILGLIGFCLFAGFGAVVLATDRPLVVAGRAAQRVRNRFVRNRPPWKGFDSRLLRERDEIKSVLGDHLTQAVLLSVSRLMFDFLCLLAALRATGSHPRPSLVLLAYAVAGIIGLLPITPGGLGLVEASLSGMLILAGVDSGAAFLATLTYRLAAYWLPLTTGPIAYALFHHRYRGAGHAPATA